MPYVYGATQFSHGTTASSANPNVYCVSDVASADFGKCYVISGKAYYIYTDTTVTLPCETDGTCIRFTNTAYNRALYTLFNYGSKQAILSSFLIRAHTECPGFVNALNYLYCIPSASPSLDFAYGFLFPIYDFSTSFPLYSPVLNVELNRNMYSISRGRPFLVKWSGMLLTNTSYLGIYEDNRNNIWYAFDATVRWMYESSPVAVIPLEYEEWIAYDELRSAFGYAVNGIDQPGWNADDIIRALEAIFPDRAWAVFDDRSRTLYIHNINFEDIPEFLIDKFGTSSIEVLKPKSNYKLVKEWLEKIKMYSGYEQIDSTTSSIAV